MYRGGGGGGSLKKKLNLKQEKKKRPIRPFLAHSGGGQETTFYLMVAL